MFWWQILVAPVATILAVVLTQRHTTRRERELWLNDNRLRWDEDRHRAYAEFASKLKHEFRLHVMFAEDHWPGTWTHHPRLDFRTNAEQLTAAENARANAFEALILLANSETVDAAREWQQSVWALRSTLGSEYDHGGQGFMELTHQTSTARDKFHRAARADLGVDGLLKPVVPTSFGEIR